MKHKLSSVPRAIALAILSAFIVTAAAPPATADLIGLVKRIKASAYGTPPGAERERKYLRFPVVQDERLETGSGAGMLVEFLDETTLTLGPDSDLVIDTFVYDPRANEGSAILSMGVGIMHFVSGKARYAAMQIKTPTTTASATAATTTTATTTTATTTATIRTTATATAATGIKAGGRFASGSGRGRRCFACPTGRGRAVHRCWSARRDHRSDPNPVRSRASIGPRVTLPNH